MDCLTRDSIDVGRLVWNCSAPQAGGIVIFCGNVRGQNNGRAVSCIEYEAHESLARIQIDQIVATVRQEVGLIAAHVVHRLGRVDVGEVAVCVVTAAEHRSEAYRANQRIINRIKHEVPIWKKEVFADGAEEWGKPCPGCAHAEHASVQDHG